MLYTHACWFVVLFSFFLTSLLISFLVTLSGTSYFLSADVFSSWFFTFELSFTFDWMSLWFMTTVLLISSVISIYSFFYMSPYYKSSIFLWLTFLFISSMLLVITTTNLFYSMLGWDGLGVVSFFLIVFYQNSTSISSGLFTLLMNRIGDGFFLASLAIMALSSPDFFSSNSFVPLSSILPVLLVLTFITKRAIYPFSSWLPMAMAAPTPISALVHSSTLVTSGLYLMMRLSYTIYSCPELIKALLITRMFTSFYAGINTIFEMDLKKLIALSTLRHLGFIGIAFSSGLLTLSFFHLLTHALFKSLLFMCIGDIIINLRHSQDIRFLSSGVHYTPFSVFTMYVSLINLLGMPNMSGFFSKDLVLESFHYSNPSLVLLGVLYANVFFTYFYTFQLFYYSFRSNKLTPFFMFHPQSRFHIFLITSLGVVSVIFGSIFTDLICYSTFFLVIPSAAKFLPIVLNVAMFTYLCLFISFPKLCSRHSFYFFSNMLGLRTFLITVRRSFYHKSSFSLVKNLELGLVNHYLHNTFINSLSYSLSYFFNLYRFQPFYVILFCLLVLLLTYFCISNTLHKPLVFIFKHNTQYSSSPPPLFFFTILVLTFDSPLSRLTYGLYSIFITWSFRDQKRYILTIN